MNITMLREYLGDTLYAQAEEKLSGIDGMQVIATHDGTWLPKARLDEEIARRRELQSALDQMAEKAGDSEKLRAQVAELTQRLEKSLRSGTLREALMRAGARDVDLVEKLLDGEEAPEEQIAALRRRSPYLFAGEGGGPRAGFSGTGRGHAAGGHADVNGAIRAAAGRY